jgi:putative ABC transport system permease protein
MPEGFYFPTPEFRAWRPLLLDPATQNYQGNGYLTILARVREGLTAGPVDDDIQALAAALGERFTYSDAWNKARGAHVTSLRDYLLGDVRPALLLLLGAVLLLLLMACANAAALILARTTDRTGEMAVRAALGAGRGRLARQVFTEAVVLSLVAAALGAGLAVALFDAVVASLPLGDGFGAAVSLHWDTFAAAFGLALLVGCVVAAMPMRHLLRGGLEDLRSERAETARVQTTGRAHGFLVAAEVLLAVTLVAGAALLIRSVARLQAVDLGLEPEGVITLDLVAGEDGMSEVERRAFFAEVERRAAALPGVHAAGLVNRLPIRDGGWQGTVGIESRPDLAGAAAPNAYWRAVTPAFFRTIGIAVTRGRGFEARDRQDAPAVTVVSEAFAARIWPGEDPIGKRIQPTFGGWLTVVGVAEETRMFGVTGANPLVTYVPLPQVHAVGLSQVLVLRSDQRPGSMIPAVRRTVRELDARVAVARAGTMVEIVATAMAESLRLRFFLMLFAGLGLLLGAVGVYGVVAYAVARRRAEFGIRMALGATAGDVLADVVRRGMVPVVLGVLGGVAVSLALSRAVGGFLYEVAPTDPGSLAAAALVLLLTGIAAAAVPAVRAGSVSPVEVLRAE